ncbi:MAG: glycosyltransferase family 2 protein [Planctomycetota bacterium]|nr:MAG: glycosyltransferase family 2 protein [Planctomycetota bacterium]
MNRKNPLVSVIMPVYNGADFLAEAIHNIQQQGYRPIEIIIVDDGSVDETATIVAQFKEDIRYVYQSNQGPAAARNTGINLATGEYIAFLDVDDLWAQNRLSTQIDFLTTHPGVDIVQGLIQDLQLVRTAHNTLTFAAVSEPYYSVNIGSAIYRRQVYDKVGLFDETLRYNEDTDWFIRAWDNNVTKTQLDEVALLYRKHDGNMTNENNSKRSGFVWLLKKRLDQQRKQGHLSGQVASDRPGSITEYIGWQR